MQKKYMILIFALTLSILSATISIVQGLNYTPSIGLGDELVWKIEEDFEGESSTIYKKYNISEIFDLSNKTFVKAEYFSSEKNIDFTYHTILTIGCLADYSEHAFDLMDYDIIIPETKISSYKEAILSSMGQEYDINSIALGYGIKVTWDDNFYTREFNKQGIMEKTKSLIDGDEFESVLYSINGEIYHSIPSYPIYLLITSSLIGVIGIILYMRSQSKK